jgi:4-amino-4-deoxy-L-arabinose transferase-like glycosyltransferase
LITPSQTPDPNVPAAPGLALGSTARLAALIFLASFLLHFLGNWTLPLCDRDEPRFAEASREMLQRGNWVVPWFNNHPRYDKPPLIYWFQATAYRLFGESEMSARLPSALSAALTAVVIFGFGRRLRDQVTGLWAAIFFSTCVQTIVHARLCVADMLMILFFTLATWCAWELVRPAPPDSDSRRPHPGWWPGLCLALALAFLAKGPIGLLPILFPFLTAQRRVALAAIRPARVALIVLVLVGLWGIPALLQTRGEFWQVGMGKHVFQRSVSVLEGHGAKNLITYLATLPLYFVTVFASFFPWSLWLVWLVRRLWSRRATLTCDEAFLSYGVLTVFILFSLVRTKLPHYTLPAFPLLCLLLACELQNAGRALQPLKRWAARMVALVMLLAFVVFPRLAPWFPSKELARQCAPWLRSDMEFASSGYTEGSLYWYFRHTLRGFGQVLESGNLPAFMAQPGPRLCILPTPELPAAFPETPAAWHRVRVDGFNLGNGKRVDLTALVKEE